MSPIAEQLTHKIIQQLVQRSTIQVVLNFLWFVAPYFILSIPAPPPLSNKIFGGISFVAVTAMRW